MDVQGSGGRQETVDGLGVQDSTSPPAKTGGVKEPEGGGATPPTPQAAEPGSKPNEASALSVKFEGERGEEIESETVESSAHKEDGEGGSLGTRDGQKEKYAKMEEIEEVVGIGTGMADDGVKRREAVSPPAPAPMDQQVGLTGINEVSKVLREERRRDL